MSMDATTMHTQAQQCARWQLGLCYESEHNPVSDGPILLRLKRCYQFSGDLAICCAQMLCLAKGTDPSMLTPQRLSIRTGGPDDWSNRRSIDGARVLFSQAEAPTIATPGAQSAHGWE